MGHFLRTCCVACISMALAGTPVAMAERLPVPDEDAIAAARSQVQAIYSDDYGSRDPGDRAALVEKLLRQASDKTNTPAEGYALLTEAINEAAALGDLTRALKSLGQVIDRFVVDETALRMDVLHSVSQARIHPGDVEAFAIESLKVLEQPIATDQVEAATRLAEAAAAMAGRIPTIYVRTAAAYRRQQLRQREGEPRLMASGRAALAEDADDPQANEDVGLLLCLREGNWRRGLPMLATSGDETVRQLARREAAPPKDSSGQIDLGNRWFEKSKTAASLKEAMVERALHWYSQAIRNASGLQRAMIDKQREDAVTSIGFPATMRALTADERPRAVPFGGKYYLAGPGGQSWKAAEQWCVARGGHLACIADARENDFVLGMAIAKAGARINVWLGGTDEGTEGGWRWADGSIWRYANWSRGEPNNSGGKEHWVYVSGKNWPHWNDYQNKARADMYFVAQWAN